MEATAADIFEILTLRCEVTSYGSTYYYAREWNTFHHPTGPAVISADGSKYWYQHGMKHRIDGPAVELTNGYKGYYLKGVEYTIDGYWKKVKELRLQKP